jgi:Domain of unknown function (DUF4136)
MSLIVGWRTRRENQPCRGRFVAKRQIDWRVRTASPDETKQLNTERQAQTVLASKSVAAFAMKSGREEQMKALRWFLPLLLVTGLAGFAVAQDVHTDYDHHIPFERFHTYSWGKVKTTNPLWEDRIREAVDKDLQEKGWQKVASGGDVVVMAVGSTQNQQEYQTFYDGLGGGWRWGGFGEEATTTVQNVRVGTLVVDMYDPSSKHLIWRGTSSETLSGNPEHNEKNLDKAVDKMFKNFPPKK